MAKSLNTQNKYGILLLLITFVSGLATSCKKVTSDKSASNTFIKTFQIDSGAIGAFVEQYPDGSFFLVSSKGNGSAFLIQTDKYGNPIWQYNTPSDPISTNNFWNVLNYADPYHFLLQTGPLVTNMDNKGNIISQNNISNASGWPSNYIGVIFPNGNNFVGS